MFTLKTLVTICKYFADLTMLMNSADDSTIGFFVEKDVDGSEDIVKEYEPAIMWNLSVQR